MPKLIVIFYGRFQPVSRAHVTVYNILTKNFGTKNVYIGTSDKTDPDHSPLSFEQKKKLWAHHGVSTDHILKTRRNYNAEEIKDQLHFKEFSDFIYVVAVGQKDSKRLSGGKFYLPLKSTDTKELDTADQHGYYWIIPNVKLGGNVLSATNIRTVLRKPSLDQQDLDYLTKATGLKKRNVQQLRKLFEFANRRKWWPMLLEGGAAGHLSHPFEDLQMTFGELKNIINLAFDGKLQLASEGPITEKVDGQNLFASVINGKVRFARNKGQLKNRGKSAMTTLDIDKKWKDIPQVRAAFMKAAQTLEAGFGKLSKPTQKEIFKDGQNWVNFELIAQENPNVINYDSDIIIFHNIQIVDDKGNKTRVASKETKKLFKIFSDAEKSSSLNMKIQPPQIVKVDKNLTIDFSADQSKFISDINKVEKSAGLSDNNSLGDLIRAEVRKNIANLESKHSMQLDKKIIDKLLARFVEGDKSYRVTDWPKDIPDAAFIDDLKILDQNSLVNNKKILHPIEMIVLRFGVILLKNIDTFISANPDTAVQQLRKSIAQQIAQIKKSNDISAIDKMQGILKKIEGMGGFKDLVPSEGIVFRYHNKLYKITGLFAPVNALMGIGRFNR